MKLRARRKMLAAEYYTLWTVLLFMGHRERKQYLGES